MTGASKKPFTIFLDDFNPQAIARKLAKKIRKKRLIRNLTQESLSKMSGVSKGIQPHMLSVLDRLSIIGSSGMGALKYEPDKHIRATQSIDDINILATEVRKIISEVDFTGSIDLLAEKGADLTEYKECLETYFYFN